MQGSYDLILVIASSGFIGVILAYIYLLAHSRAVVARRMAFSLIIYTIIAAMMLYLKFTEGGIVVFGAITVMRFREALKDHRDFVFLFLSIASGFTCASHQFGLLAVGYLVIILVLALTGSIKKTDRILFVVRGKSEDENSLIEAINLFAENKMNMKYNNSKDGKYAELIYEVKERTQDKIAMCEKLKDKLYSEGFANEINIVYQRDDMKI